MVMKIKATPMAPTEGTKDMRVKTYIQPGLANPDIPRPAVEAPTTTIARRCKLTKQEFEKFWYNTWMHWLQSACSRVKQGATSFGEVQGAN